MERLLYVSLCLLACFGKTFGDVERIKEGINVILNCSHPGKDDLTNKVFEWKKDGQEVFFYEDGKHYNNNGRQGQHENFKNRVEFFQDKLQFGNASIRIKNTKVTDSGNYSCGFPDPKVVHHKLVVDLILKDRTGEDTNGAFAKPSVSTDRHESDWAQLRCEVLHAFPKPSVVWYDNARNNISDRAPQESEKDGYYDIILMTKVTKRGNYTCEATQAELYHQCNKTTDVFLSGSNNRAEGKTTIKLIFLLLLVVVDLLP